MPPALLTKTDFAHRMQLAAWVAIVSVIFQQYDDLFAPRSDWFFIGSVLMLASLFLYLIESWRTRATWLFVAGMLVHFLPNWYTAANHSWLAVWALLPLLLYPQWWERPEYSRYLRYTLGVVMIAAGLQKLVAGTYLDGSYIAWMSHYGSTTEQALWFLCPTAEPSICGWYVAFGAAAVLWQFAAGALLLLGWRGIVFLAIEVGFLLAVGVFADEMNFQVLNIALLCLAFRFGMPLWLAAVSVGLLCVDVIGISEIITLLV